MSEVEGKAPAYQWYARDFSSDEFVQLMTLEEEGAYRRLLDHQWLHGSIPADVAQIARICKNTPLRRMQKMWGAIAPCFVSVEGDAGRLQNRRMERERVKSQEYRDKQSEKGKHGADIRWERERAKREQRARAWPDDSTGNAPAMAGAWPDDSTTDCSLQSASALTTTASSTTRENGTEIDLVTRLVAAANAGLAEHVTPARRQLDPLNAASAASRHATEAIVSAGVPIDFAEREIGRIARTCEPEGKVSSLRYFVAAVTRAWSERESPRAVRNGAARRPPGQYEYEPTTEPVRVR